ncbi:MAG: hypothetical protein HY833_03625 [Candidatus Aenigmarchaeota archaeon]|nr:hypothetical protein [Candidatus Aenigmarchaeota archaeon]
MDPEYIDSEFKVVEVRLEDEMPGFGDYLLLRLNDSAPFEVYNQTHKIPKKGMKILGLLRGDGVRILESGKRGLIVKNREASAVGKIVKFESWTENLQEGVMRGNRMFSKTTKKKAYTLIVNCNSFYVIVEREYMKFAPKKDMRVRVEKIRDLTNNPKNVLKSCVYGSDIC